MNTVQNKLALASGGKGSFIKQKILFRLKIGLCIMITMLVFGSQEIFSQGVGISEVSITPEVTSILELRSSLRGFLAPRMTTLERDAIVTPAQGLLIYNTDTRSFWYYDNGWKAFASGAWGAANQLLGMNAAGNANEYKTLSGTLNQIFVAHGVGSIVLSTPQDIHLNAIPTFDGLTLSLLTPNAGVYTNGTRRLTSIPPSSGTIGYWTRNDALGILSPSNLGDDITTTGDIYTTGPGTITSAGLLTGQAGATISGADINLNNNSNFLTNINTGTSTGDVTIGNTASSLYLKRFTTAGVLHNLATTGEVTSSLIVNADVNANAGISISKLAYGTDAQIIVGSATGVPTYR
nr:hypothetical protein [Bacteroidales bacterium]